MEVLALIGFCTILYLAYTQYQEPKSNRKKALKINEEKYVSILRWNDPDVRSLVENFKREQSKYLNSDMGIMEEYEARRSGHDQLRTAKVYGLQISYVYEESLQEFKEKLNLLIKKIKSDPVKDGKYTKKLKEQLDQEYNREKRIELENMTKAQYRREYNSTLKPLFTKYRYVRGKTIKTALMNHNNLSQRAAQELLIKLSDLHTGILLKKNDNDDVDTELYEYSII